MRLIAVRLLANPTGMYYVQGELVSRPPRPLVAPSGEHIYHVYCSTLNLGSIALMEEVCRKMT